MTRLRKRAYLAVMTMRVSISAVYAASMTSCQRAAAGRSRQPARQAPGAAHRWLSCCRRESAAQRLSRRRRTHATAEEHATQAPIRAWGRGPSSTGGMQLLCALLELADAAAEGLPELRETLGSEEKKDDDEDVDWLDGAHALTCPLKRVNPHIRVCCSH